MHIAEGFLSPIQCAIWYAASAPFVVHGARAVIAETRKNPENRMLLGAAGAFTFVLSSIKLPSGAADHSHEEDLTIATIVAPSGLRSEAAAGGDAPAADAKE